MLIKGGMAVLQETNLKYMNSLLKNHKLRSKGGGITENGNLENMGQGVTGFESTLEEEKIVQKILQTLNI